MIAIFPRFGGGMVAMTEVDELMLVALGEGWWWEGWGRICAGFFLSYLFQENKKIKKT